MLKIDHRSQAPKSVFNIAWGEGALRDNQELLETVLEQGKRYKKPFYPTKVITLISVPTNFILHCKMYVN